MTNKIMFLNIQNHPSNLSNNNFKSSLLHSTRKSCNSITDCIRFTSSTKHSHAVNVSNCLYSSKKFFFKVLLSDAPGHSSQTAVDSNIFAQNVFSASFIKLQYSVQLEQEGTQKASVPIFPP